MGTDQQLGEPEWDVPIGPEAYAELLIWIWGALVPIFLFYFEKQ
jgi:hypothetical protein